MLPYRALITRLCKSIGSNKDYLLKAKQNYIFEDMWKTFVNQNRRILIKDPSIILNKKDELDHFTVNLQKIADKHPDTLDESYKEEIKLDSSFHNVEKDLFKKFLKKAKVDLGSSIDSFKILCTYTDLRAPHEWYPYTRLLRRKIIYHGGPTNSGKTYHALKRLKEADPNLGGGVYAGPLRLLALEIYEKLNSDGVYTSLLTGQEQRFVPFGTHLSCTIEMLNIERNYDVAVIDEIQRIGNEQRGWSWTRALQVAILCI